MYTSIDKLINTVKETFKDDKKIGDMFEKCFLNTINTTIKRMEDKTSYVLTGDIPAMWLRDSVCQVRPYLVLANEDSEIADMIEGLVERQFRYILVDPYANAFNEEANGAGHQNDLTDMKPDVWERKYEIDSLCFPIQLSYLLYKNTGRTSHFNDTFKKAVHTIIDLWKVEQNHEEKCIPASGSAHADRRTGRLRQQAGGSTCRKQGCRRKDRNCAGSDRRS